MTHTLPIAMLSLLALGCGGKRIIVPINAFHDPASKAPVATGSELPAALGLKTAAAREPAASLPAPDSGFRAQNTAERDRSVKATLSSINKLLDAYFDFNAYHLRPEAVTSLTEAASVLKEYMAADPAIRLIVEGHCDERGSAEFNLGLGDRRAESVRDLLAQMALPTERMSTISYGEARPACADATEACWQQNRRAHIRHER